MTGHVHALAAAAGHVSERARGLESQGTGASTARERYESNTLVGKQRRP